MDIETGWRRSGRTSLLASPARPAAVVAAIERIHGRLAAAPSLRPGRRINGLLHRLVDIVVDTPRSLAVEVVTDPRLQAIQADLVGLCARAEQELELAWARRILASRRPRHMLRRFPYLDNYRLLTRLEHATLQRVAGPPPRRILFVGAGPLPLSPLLLAQHLDTPITSLDRDPAAVDACVALADRLGARHIDFRHGELTDDADHADHADLAGYDLVVLAALVGLTPAEKHRHLVHLHEAMAPGALLLARSAEGLRTLLYPAIDATRLHGFELLATTHPVGPVLNSTLLARKPPRRGPEPVPDTAAPDGGADRP